MAQKLKYLGRKPLRTPPFIAVQLLHTEIALTWKILGFIAWRPHMSWALGNVSIVRKVDEAHENVKTIRYSVKIST